MNKKVYPYLIVISAIFFFIPFLGSVHLFDWDEINFAESAREMLVTGNFSQVQIDFHPFLEKPPLFFWMQALSMKLFGINEFAARFPNAAIGIFTLVTFYFIGKKLYDEKFGLIWALAYMGSFLPHIYFKSGIIDPFFNYFIFLGIVFIAKSIGESDQRRGFRYALFAGISIGLATLTKGPVGLLIAGISVLIYWATAKSGRISSWKNILIFALSCLIISSLWFGLEMINNGFWFINGFIKYQAELFLKPGAGHSGPIYYHFLIVFLGCFPLSVLALPVIFRKKAYSHYEGNNFLKWMLILFWVVMILFTIVKTKIVHYSSLAYFPLSYFAASFIYELLNKRAEFKRYLLWILLLTGTVLSIILIGLPLAGRYNNLIIPYLKDEFAIACLNSPVMWNGYEFLIGIGYLLILFMALFIMKRNQYFRGIIILFYATAFCIFFYLKAVVPKIEGYSQAPAVNFYKSLSGKDVYVTSIGFYSYAYYFYFQKMPGGNSQNSNKDWLLNGDIDKPVYMVAKSTSKKLFDNHPDCRFIKQEGGFLFYCRMPKTDSL
ncbi:MAG: glycosyltransferase family 39 protein [Bacteroidetes bacterium]|nr:MAG: glycosyltransferase family 39 protein [Bacteroidota bacterium]